MKVYERLPPKFLVFSSGFVEGFHKTDYCQGCSQVRALKVSTLCDIGQPTRFPSVFFSVIKKILSASSLSKRNRHAIMVDVQLLRISGLIFRAM